MPAYARLACLLSAALCLPGCVPLLTALGSGSSVIAVAAQVERVKLVGDGISYAKSKKTLTDHALSMVADSDCRLMNILSGEKVCVPTADAETAQVAQRDATDTAQQVEVQSRPETETAKFEPANEQAAGE